ncbi:hypothetical protein [Streptomyces sp. enrichment culture]|uniref:hypothetical protein n=1 Tax=Streptomyces sp. enrichment culture TaxID=1795815 RepID=UPI003F55042D
MAIRQPAPVRAGRNTSVKVPAPGRFVRGRAPREEAAVLVQGSGDEHPVEQRKNVTATSFSAFDGPLDVRPPDQGEELHMSGTG